MDGGVIFDIEENFAKGNVKRGLGFSNVDCIVNEGGVFFFG